MMTDAELIDALPRILADTKARRALLSYRWELAVPTLTRACIEVVARMVPPVPSGDARPAAGADRPEGAAE